MPQIKGFVSKKVKTDKNIKKKKELIMMNVNKYFDKVDDDKKELIKKVITNKSSLSIHDINSFITDISKNNNIFVNGEHVYSYFKTVSKTFGKENFEIFKRGTKITYSFNKVTEEFQTTVSQLNFFKWLDQNKILDFILMHTKLEK